MAKGQKGGQLKTRKGADATAKAGMKYRGVNPIPGARGDSPRNRRQKKR